MSQKPMKVMGICIEEFDTSIDCVSVGDKVEGHYYFSRVHSCGMVVTSLREECGGVEGCSGLIEAHIKVDNNTIQLIARGELVDKREIENKQADENMKIDGEFYCEAFEQGKNFVLKSGEYVRKEDVLKEWHRWYEKYSKNIYSGNYNPLTFAEFDKYIDALKGVG